MDTNQNTHFVDDKSYQPEGCCLPTSKEDIGNQPNISDSYSTDEFQVQSIPHYPGNPCKMGKNY